MQYNAFPLSIWQRCKLVSEEEHNSIRVCRAYRTFCVGGKDCETRMLYIHMYIYRRAGWGDVETVTAGHQPARWEEERTMLCYGFVIYLSPKIGVSQRVSQRLLHFLRIVPAFVDNKSLNKYLQRPRTRSLNERQNNQICAKSQNCEWKHKLLVKDCSKFNWHLISGKNTL